MDASKIKVGKTYSYTTPRGTTSGRMKVSKIDSRPTGWWITGRDKERKLDLTLRPGNLSA